MRRWILADLGAADGKRRPGKLTRAAREELRRRSQRPLRSRLGCAKPSLSEYQWRGTMSGPHEQLEHAEHVEHAGHSNKKIALVIVILALGLSFSETLGKSAQTEGISLNIKASDTWNFFQAKTVRQTTLRVAAQGIAIEAAAVTDEAKKAAMLKLADDWMKTVTRYDSDPKEKDGRKELKAQAEEYERDRDLWFAKYHNYEYSSAAYQIGIVLASAAVITGIVALAYTSIGLGLIGLVFTGLGLFAPHLPHEATHWMQHLFQASGTH
jgi:hypothetical protein